ncbi:DegT/DnrJ/EryC1/StrS family aminotransferase [Phenylobacterium sp.]|uniref:DegT/DnrJ/EryC1/StrS family aminotransferase n=1 Tax=Phenylobacterium sp. TaxID=1871053 RepID=UPI0039839C35
MAPPSQVPVMRPLLPPASELLPFLEEIDAARWYSNMGPLVHRLEARLAEHFDVDVSRVVTSANGTLAMVQVLQAMQVKAGSLCVMPSWTFVATAAAAHAAGLKPFFVDIDPLTWAIDPADVSALMAQGHDVGAVIPVAPFGAPIALQAWEDFHTRTAVPVLVDAAAGFDSFASVKTSLPYMVSMHATKVFGVGEGAVVVSPDAELARAIRRTGNFGFDGSRDAQVPGFNAKLSEYAAAVGLAGFQRWADTRASWADLAARFHEKTLATNRVRLAPDFGNGWLSSYGIVELDPAHNAVRVCEAFARRGVETRLWWGKGCHAHPAYEGCGRTALPYTDDLANRVVGLPFWVGLDAASLDYVFDCLGEILARGE